MKSLLGLELKVGHPESDAQLVKHQPASIYDNRYGKQITSSEHLRRVGRHVFRTEVRLSHRPSWVR